MGEVQRCKEPHVLKILKGHLIEHPEGFYKECELNVK